MSTTRKEEGANRKQGSHQRGHRLHCKTRHFGATNRAYTMGIFSDLFSEAYRGGKVMPGCEGSQQSYYPGEPQASDSGGNCSSADWSSGLHEGRCPQGLSTGTLHQSKQQAAGHQYQQRQVQVQADAIWR